jgi:DNA-binding HxlR family transcriptional regulator
VEHLQGAYQLEEKLLKQRLQALENQTVLNLIEGKQISPPHFAVTLEDEAKKDSEVYAPIASDDETLESYEEF